MTTKSKTRFAATRRGARTEAATDDDVVSVERKGPSRWRWVCLVLLAGYLLFAHGCHLGDHDDELFIRCVNLLTSW